MPFREHEGYFVESKVSELAPGKMAGAGIKIGVPEGYRQSAKTRGLMEKCYVGHGHGSGAMAGEELQIDSF
jgi:hypothetical protein